METWLSLESNDESKSAKIDNYLEGLGDICTMRNCVDGRENSVNEKVSDDDCEDTVPLAPMSKIIFRFHVQENILYSSFVEEALIHLRRARIAFMAEKMKQGTTARQTVITEQFPTTYDR